MFQSCNLCGTSNTKSDFNIVDNVMYNHALGLSFTWIECVFCLASENIIFSKNTVPLPLAGTDDATTAADQPLQFRSFAIVAT